MTIVKLVNINISIFPGYGCAAVSTVSYGLIARELERFVFSEAV
jgi:hypothetical protein